MGEPSRQTLFYIKKLVNEIKILKFRSGTKAFDWIVPEEWNIKDAYIKDIKGKKILDFKKNLLSVVYHSMPINKWINRKDLLEKIHSDDSLPNAVPYVTSYYRKYWGFCMSANQKKKLKSKKYFIKIDSSFKKGFLEIGEYFKRGSKNKEIFFSTYTCHPSMANDNTASLALQIYLIKYVKEKYKKSRFSYRFIFIPETIGSICYLSKKYKVLKKNMLMGFAISCVGDNKQYSIIQSREGGKLSDKALEAALVNKKNLVRYSYLERGSDERQFNWPGIDIPMTSFFRTKYGEYPEYHTSEDTFGRVVTKKGLMGSFKIMKFSIESIMKNYYPIATVFCEPKMDKRGLYSYLSFTEKKFNYQRKYIDFMIYSDGKNNIDQIAKKIKLNYKISFKIFKLLLNKKLIRV